MTPEAFLLLVHSCRLDLPAGVTAERLSTYAEVESGRNPRAIGAPNRDGSRDYGLLQINDQHFRRFGVDARTVMEPCANLRIGAAILADADRQASCIWNTGRARCANGYDLKIMRAASRLAAADAPAAPAPPPPPPKPPEEPACAPTFDSWALAMCRERQERDKRRARTPEPKTEPREDQ